MNKTKANK